MTLHEPHLAVLPPMELTGGSVVTVDQVLLPQEPFGSAQLSFTVHDEAGVYLGSNTEVLLVQPSCNRQQSSEARSYSSPPPSN